MTRVLLAALHLLALGIGLGSVWARSRALRGALDDAGARRVLLADTWWGLAGFLWIATGLARLFAGSEKPTEYYLHNHVFWAKMGFLLLLLALEAGPIVTFTRWRRSLARGEAPDLAAGRRFAGTSVAQAVLVLAMLLAATSMARGYGG